MQRNSSQDHHAAKESNREMRDGGLKSAPRISLTIPPSLIRVSRASGTILSPGGAIAVCAVLRDMRRSESHRTICNPATLGVPLLRSSGRQGDVEIESV